MSLAEFVKTIAPLIQYFGVDNYPKPVLERIHYKCQDLNRSQVIELMNLLLDTCEFAPKVPRFIEASNMVRARHREGIRGETLIDDGPRTPEVAAQAIATIHNIFKKTKGLT